jgi:ferrous iron transport protein A
MLLVNIKPGIRYQIDSIDCSDKTTIRLMILGFVEGTKIELISSAIGGDPMEFSVFGNTISVRREQARRFSVSPV